MYASILWLDLQASNARDSLNLGDAFIKRIQAKQWVLLP